MSESRTKLSIKNSAVALGMYLINMFLQFFSRKIFLEYLGTEILGLNTTATNLLQFLNLAELGIGAAIAFSLYKPLFENNHDEISEILAVQKWLYRRIAYLVIGGSLILMCFFPLIFEKMKLPMWYAFASYAVLLFSSLLSYFVNYKEVLLSADQKEYKIQFSYRLVMMLKICAQIFAISSFHNGYVWWLILEFLFAIIGSWSINYVVKRTYPFLNECKISYAVLKERHADIVTKIKQLFFHKIGSFVLSQTSPLIIYAFATLTTVALYGNYMMVINGCMWLIVAMFNSMAGGIGNLIASGDKEKIITVFNELFSIRFVFIFSLSVVIYYSVPPFVKLWIGAEYLLDNGTLLFMVGIFYIMTSRLTVDAFVNGYGLYSDIWAPVAEGAVNIGFSILLGSRYGLEGVVAGVFLSLFLSMFVWKPYFLFSRKLKGFYKVYLWQYARHLIAAGIVIAGVAYLTSIYTVPDIDSYSKLILYSTVLGLICMGAITILLVVFRCGVIQFFSRLKKLCILK